MNVYLQSIIIISISLLFFSGCRSRDVSKLGDNGAHQGNDSKEIKVRDSLEMETHPVLSRYARNLEPFVLRSVEEGWSIDEWRVNAGNPPFIRDIEDITLLEYIDPDIEPEGTTGEIVSGVIVEIRNGKTEKIRWEKTRYGVPDGYKISDDGRLVRKRAR